MLFRICFLAFLLALLSVVKTLVEDSIIAQPYNAGTDPMRSPVAVQRREAEKECGFQGNSDLYGLGVRIGIYLQYFSSAVSQIFDLPQESSYASITFAFALIVAVITLTVQGVAYLIEPIIFYYLFIGAPLCSLSEYTYVSTRIWGRLQVDLHFCLRAIAGWFISIMMWVYMIWFWLGGKGSGMFQETPFPNGYRYIRQTLDAKNRAITTISKTSSALQRTRGKYGWGYILNTIACILGFVVTITGTELALRWNKVKDVYSANTTGQLIPLILGLCGAIRVVYLIAKKFYLSRGTMTKPPSMQMEPREHYGEAEITAIEGPADYASANALNTQSYRVSAEVAQGHPLNHQGQDHHHRRVETV